MKITKFCYRIDVISKSLTTTFLVGMVNNKVYKASLLDDLMKHNMLHEIKVQSVPNNPAKLLGDAIVWF